MDDLPLEDSIVTAADVPLLNRAVIDDACRFARTVATWLGIVAFLGGLAWMWLTWKGIDALTSTDRDTVSIGGIYVDADGDVPTVGDYFSLFAQTSTYLLFAAMVAGVAVGIRLAAAHVGSVAGVDVSDVAVGEPLAESDEERFGDG